MELRIQGVSKTYANGVRALRDVTLTIPAGMYGLLGPNGAGKSTLMRILATLQEADEGTASLGEIDVLNQKDEVRKTLGYLPQEFGVYPKVSAEELLEHFALLKGIAERRARREVVEALLRQTNLWEVRRQKLGGYSGGMKQRFGVAVALLGNPKLMIVDEPTAGLDPAERVRFLNLLSGIGRSPRPSPAAPRAPASTRTTSSSSANAATTWWRCGRRSDTRSHEGSHRGKRNAIVVVYKYDCIPIPAVPAQ